MLRPMQTQKSGLWTGEGSFQESESTPMVIRSFEWASFEHLRDVIVRIYRSAT
jgi:hypothetical protein